VEEMGKGASCCGVRMVGLKMSYVKQQKFKANGLRSALVELDDDATVVRCWLPWQQPERGVWSAGVADKPAVLLLHDFVADGTVNWEKQIKALTTDFNVYVPDLVFFGRSETSKEERTEAFQAECMVKMLHALEVYNEVSARIALLPPPFGNPTTEDELGSSSSTNSPRERRVTQNLAKIVQKLYKNWQKLYEIWQKFYRDESFYGEFCS
jgi:hypothetical protein